MRRALVVAWLALACGPGEEPAAPRATEAEPLLVYAVNEPMRYFAERIGGDDVRVVLPAPRDVDPAHWSPAPEEIAAYQTADLILLNGAGYAGWVARATLPEDRLVDTSAGYRERLIPRAGGVTHRHGPAGDHSHGELASTTWLDPTLAIEQARAVSKALAAARPEAAEAFRQRTVALESELRALDARQALAAERLGDAPILFSHPVYQYLQQRYGLNGRSLHWEADAAPTPAQWRELDALLAEHPATLLVWEGEPLPGTVAELEARGLRSRVYAPAGNRPPAGDWLATMRANARALESGG